MVAGLIVGMASPVARAASPSLASAVARVQVTNVVKTMPQGDNHTIPDITAAAAVLTLLFPFSAIRAMETDPPIRVICVPPRSGMSSPEQWNRAGWRTSAPSPTHWEPSRGFDFGHSLTESTTVGLSLMSLGSDD